ncbi:unnamed protein product [Chondrus crispus]|uniref:Uncharacterized protein n=1 Tax=Chondrus crispus TaxID=2769 RepID=R7QDU0_CHOCR|nr:unnamed protein product [Chondrus crispus]CDF35928.1 unnamed protein product [Chondrus crispus]|eukprot:XP_005715747.1 unnamed protein product [Chondrus crispus]
MTCIATGYVVKTKTWYPNLRIYLSPWYRREHSGAAETFELHQMEDSTPAELVQTRYRSLSLCQRIKGGRIDRHLLILSAILYIAMELVTLIISLLKLLQDLSTVSPMESVFVDVNDCIEARNCPIRVSDVASEYLLHFRLPYC